MLYALTNRVGGTDTLMLMLMNWKFKRRNLMKASFWNYNYNKECPHAARRAEQLRQLLKAA